MSLGNSSNLFAATTATVTAVANIPFNSNVPLGATSVMDLKVVTGPIVFSPTNPTSGYICIAELIADGINVPTYSGFEEHSSSALYLNTAGYTNLIQFFVIGSRKYYSISQPVNQTVTDVTAPVLTSAIVANATPTKLALLFNEALNTGFVPAASAFTVTGHTVSAVEVTGLYTNLTVDTFVFGEAARTVTYTKPATNGIRDAAGNQVASFNAVSVANNVGVVPTVPAAPTNVVATPGDARATTTFTPGSDGGSTITGYIATSTPGGFTGSGTSSPIAVTGLTNGTSYTFKVNAVNNVGNGPDSAASNSVTPIAAAADAPVRFASLINVTETGSTDPYTYTGNGTAFGTAMGGIATKSRVIGTDGYCSVVLGAATDTTHEIMLGLDNSATAVTYTALDYAIFAPNTGTYRVVVGGVSTAATVSVACALNDVMRLKITGTTLDAQVSKDSGTTWTTIYTWTGITDTSIKYHIQTAKVGIAIAGKIAGAV